MDEFGGPCVIGVDAAHPGCGEEHVLRTLGVEKPVDSGAVGKVKLGVRAQQETGERPQPPICGL